MAWEGLACLAKPHICLKGTNSHGSQLAPCDWELNTSWGPGMRKKEPLPHSEPRPSSQDPLQQQTAWAISQLVTRRYRASCKKARSEWPDSGSSCSSAPVCAICLEEFSEGQVRHGWWLAPVTGLGGKLELGGRDTSGFCECSGCMCILCVLHSAEVGDSLRFGYFFGLPGK